MTRERPSFENKESRESLPREIELKIVNLGDAEEFKKKILAVGGQLLQDRRLLQDTGFKFSKEAGQENTFNLDIEKIKNPEKLKTALNYLGVEIIAEEKNILKIKSRQDQTPRTARTRIDGGRSTLTVKEKRRKGAEIDDRPEIELNFPDMETAKNILENIGYQPASIREKYRTTYKIGEVLVEINEGPVGQPWAEIEGPSAEAVKKTVERLGFKPEDTAAISDRENYIRQGIPKEKLDNLTFNNK